MLTEIEWFETGQHGTRKGYLHSFIDRQSTGVLAIVINARGGIEFISPNAIKVTISMPAHWSEANG
jgi:hypothetical protein